MLRKRKNSLNFLIMGSYYDLVSTYNSGKYALFVMTAQTVATAKVRKAEYNLAQQLINKMAQVSNNSLSNNPTNTGKILNLYA
jgi:hypothetical protein